MSRMGNDRVRVALAEAGMSAADLASRIGVDPKTVERWINPGRRPYTRTAHRAAAALRKPVAWLWPEIAPESAARPGEFVALYPERAAVPRDTWIRLLTGAERQIDVLVFSGTFFAQSNPRVAAMLRERAARGVRVRLCDPASEAVELRGHEEGLGDSLAAKIKASLTYYRPLVDVEGCEVRLHGATLYASMFRYDDMLLVNPHIWGQPASANPLLHVRRREDHGVFDRYVDGFDAVWRSAKPWAPE